MLAKVANSEVSATNQPRHINQLMECLFVWGASGGRGWSELGWSGLGWMQDGLDSIPNRPSPDTRRGLVLPALVAAHRLPLRPDNHSRVVRLRQRSEHLNLIFAKNRRQNSLDLQVTKLLTHALVHATAKAEVRVRGFVLFARRGEAVRIEQVRLFEHVRQTHRHRRCCDDNISLRDRPLPAILRLDRHVLHRLAHQHDERRVHAQGLLHAVVHELKLLHVLERQSLAAHHIVHLVDHPLHDLRPRAAQQRRPGRGHAASVLSREEQGDEQASDLVVGILLPALVLHINEHLEDVRVVLRLLRVGPALLDHLAEELHHLLARVVARLVRRDRRVREEEGEGGDALVKVVVEMRDLSEEVLAHVVAVEAARGGEDGEVGEDREQVDLALLAPALDEILRLFHDLRHIRFEPVGAEALGHVEHLLLPHLGLGVVHHVGAEHSLHEAVHLGLREHRVGRFEEGRRHVGPDQKGEVLAHHPDRVDRAELLVGLHDEADR
mmetsp:Transcript_35408/g.94929  ORF Transcript_35408/g.94929 Transcript_35408/m.94929 type:complete len:495 (-) Transcript_35408:194-1678(-)